MKNRKCVFDRTRELEGTLEAHGRATTQDSVVKDEMVTEVLYLIVTTLGVHILMSKG